MAGLQGGMSQFGAGLGKFMAGMRDRALMEQQANAYQRIVESLMPLPQEPQRALDNRVSPNASQGERVNRLQQFMQPSAPQPAPVQNPTAKRSVQQAGGFNSIAPMLMKNLQTDFGLSPAQAAGVVGNLAHESGGFTQLQEKNPVVPGSRGGFGYAQWTGPRRRAFEAWAQQAGLDPASPEANWGFLKHELTSTPEGRVLAELKSAPDAATAARVFQDRFLRPGIPHTDSRLKWTERAMAFNAPPVEGQLPAQAMPAALPPTVPTSPNMEAGPLPPTVPPGSNFNEFAGMDAAIAGDPSALNAPQLRPAEFASIGGVDVPPQAQAQPAPAPAPAPQAPMPIQPQVPQASAPGAVDFFANQELLPHMSPDTPVAYPGQSLTPASPSGGGGGQNPLSMIAGLLSRNPQAAASPAVQRVANAMLPPEVAAAVNSLPAAERAKIYGGLATKMLERQALPEQTKPTSGIQEYEYARSQGYSGSFQQWQLDKSKAGATNVTTNVGGEKIPDALLKSAIESTTKADMVSNQVDELTNFREILRTTPTGWMEATTMPMRQALKSMGFISDENIPAQELVQALQNQQALRLRNPDSGFGLTGNTSDRDVKFLKDAIGGLQNTPQGNEAMMTTMIAKQRREALLERAKADFIFETGSLKGWSERRKQIVEETPFFTPEEQQAMMALKQEAATSGPPQIQSDDDYNRLPSGATFIAPDGTTRRKP